MINLRMTRQYNIANEPIEELSPYSPSVIKTLRNSWKFVKFRDGYISAPI